MISAKTLFSDAPNREQAAELLLADFVYVIEKNQYWWVSQRKFTSQRALNVILTPVLQRMGVGYLPSRWLREQEGLRKAWDIGSYPDQRDQLIVDEHVNILWGVPA